MAASKGEETALGSARGRFNESLPRKAIELRGAMALLAATPGAEGPREDMRRRLHTLYASALVFRNDALAGVVKEGIERLDAARDQKRPLDSTDLDHLSMLVRRLPDLRGDAAAPGTPSQRPAAFTMSGSPSNRPPSRPPRTLTGLAPVGLPSAQPSTQPSRPSGLLPPVRGAAIAPTRRGPLLQMVVHVLALDRHEELAQLRALLPNDSFELTPSQNVDEALACARANAPDVVLADRELALQGELVRRLRSDPLTDFVPVVLVQNRADAVDALALRSAGADEVLLRPLESDTLAHALGRVTGTLLEESTGLTRLGDATLEEVAQRVSEEIRRGIVESAESGRDLRVPLGEGAEVLAAAWAAVARVRAFVSQQSGGRVRFQDQPRRGGPALLGLVGGEQQSDAPLAEGTLQGRRMLVVDDDPAVVWFFAGLLREEGAVVIETTDGMEALKAARKERPDVVISDILMPNLDGFALCRELKRDPSLADVPVILISWKEDLLHRMRELSAGASGYLRKEAGAARILESVRDVLRPRATLETQLAAGGEVRGSLEGTGVVALIRSTKRARPNARLSIRDAWNLFEVELRGGRMLQLTRTASDGSFMRGPRALPQLLGASAGRFVITDADAPLKAMFEGSLDEVLRQGSIELGALTDAVTGGSLMRVGQVIFDDDAYPAVLKSSPGPVRDILERLQRGEAPSLLLVAGVSSAQTLESVLIDLARRGAIVEVVAKSGEDLVAEARRARSEQTAPAIRSIVPEAPRPVISMLAPAAEAHAAPDLPSVLDPASASPSEPSPAARSAPPADASAAAELAHKSDDEIPTNQFASVSREHADQVLAEQAAPPTPQVPAWGRERNIDETHPLRTISSEPPPPADDLLGDVDLPIPAELGLQTDAEVLPRGPDDAPRSEPPQASATATTGASENLAAREADGAETRGRALQSPPSADPPDPDVRGAEEKRSRSTLWAWVAALLILFALAFVAERGLEPARPGSIQAIGAHGSRSDKQEDQPTVTVSPAPAPTEPKAAAPADPPERASPLPRANVSVAPEDSGFEVFEGITDPMVVTTSTQGLLIVEGSAGAASTLSIDGGSALNLPARIPLEQGLHELSIAHGDRTSYRYVSIRPGKTWRLSEL
jgi:CheY-like chemotaxis protein